MVRRETETDRRNELEIAHAFGRVTGLQFVRIEGAFSPLDFRAVRGGRNVGLLEVKARDKFWPTMFIEVSKVRALEAAVIARPEYVCAGVVWAVHGTRAYSRDPGWSMRYCDVREMPVASMTIRRTPRSKQTRPGDEGQEVYEVPQEITHDVPDPAAFIGYDWEMAGFTLPAKHRNHKLPVIGGAA